MTGLATRPGSSTLPDATRSIRERYAAAYTFQDFLAAARANVDLWRAVLARAVVSEAAAGRARAAGGPWHLLALAEDWCGDAVNSLPVIARLVEHAPNLDLRVLPRDANLDIMDAHLTNESRSIPVVIVYDDDFRERAWWGPRPQALQSWVLTEGRTLDKETRYREVRRWYARDRGVAIVDEVVTLIERAAAEKTPAALSPPGAPADRGAPTPGAGVVGATSAAPAIKAGAAPG